MRLGIFAKTFARPSVEETFDAVRAHGLDAVQVNLSALAHAPAERVRAAADGLEIAALSGTFNMADSAVRADGLRGLDEIAATGLAPIITLCTGSRDPEDMWRRHPDNDSAEAWQDMVETMLGAVAIAERRDVVLAIEPELGNVVSSPRAARQLLDELQTPRLKVVLDAANLPDTSRAVLTEAFDLLADDIVLAHAKDITVDGEFAAAGRGDVDWEHYLSLLYDSGYTGALVMHGLGEDEVAASTAFLAAKI